MVKVEEIIKFKYSNSKNWRQITKAKAIEQMGNARDGIYGVKYFEGWSLEQVAVMWDNYIHTAFID